MLHYSSYVAIANHTIRGSMGFTGTIEAHFKLHHIRNDPQSDHTGKSKEMSNLSVAP